MDNNEQYKAKQIWLERVMASNLTPAAKVFAFAIFTFMYGTKVECYPDTEKIMEAGGFKSHGHFTQYRNSLFDEKVLTGVLDHRGNSKQAHWTYTLNLDWDGTVTPKEPQITKAPKEPQITVAPKGLSVAPKGLNGGTIGSNEGTTGASNTISNTTKESSKESIKEIDTTKEEKPSTRKPRKPKAVATAPALVSIKEPAALTGPSLVDVANGPFETIRERNKRFGLSLAALRASDAKEVW